MHSRCVTNLRPLLESGTMGAKGHVQVSSDSCAGSVFQDGLEQVFHDFIFYKSPTCMLYVC